MKEKTISGWIRPSSWNEDLKKKNYLIRFRRVLDAQGPAELKLSADSRYKFFVNGQLVCFGPGKGDDKVRYFDPVDLRPFLKKGRNILAAEVLCVCDDPASGNHSLFTAGVHALYVEGLEEGWKCRISDVTEFYAEEEDFAPLHIHECAKEDPENGWKNDGFDDSGWEEAVEVKEDLLPLILRKENLQSRTIPFSVLTPHSFRLPVQVIPPYTEQSFVLDAGEEMTAFLKFTIHGGKGAEVILLESECYVTDEGKGNRLDSVNGHLEGYRDRYTASGGENTFEPFWWRTFRFLSVTVKTKEEPLELDALDYIETGYPLEIKTEVSVSDPTLKPVWEISLRTLRRCMHDTYMDCPFYEQLSYVMDTRAQILYTYALSGDDRLARQSIDDFSRSQREDGLLNACYPNKNANVIPGFSIYYILILNDHMMYFGDKKLLRRYLPVVKKILDYFHQHRTPSGLVDKIGGLNRIDPVWSFIDWSDPWMKTTGMPDAGMNGPVTMESLLYLLGLQKAAELTEYAGNPDIAERYRTQAEELKQRIRQYCMDEDGMITDGPGAPQLSQHCQVFGILTGVLEKEEGRRNMLKVMKDPSAAKCTVAMGLYLFEALRKTGLYAYTTEYWDIWREMVDNGCSTCVESPGNPRSECHAWGALALYEMPSVILGVRPGSPGYETIIVEPEAGFLDRASGSVYTPWGNVKVSWRKENGEMKTAIDAEETVLKRIKAK